MNQFVLQYGKSAELLLFPHILELGMKKNGSIQANSFPATVAEGLRIYHIIEGRFEWYINHQPHVFYPGDVALIMPGIQLSSDNSVLTIGSFIWIQLAVQKLDNGHVLPGKWSRLSDSEATAIGKILFVNNLPALSRFNEVCSIIKCIYTELVEMEVAYQTRINQHIDELLIQVTRKITRQTHSTRDFPQAFTNLEMALRQDLSHQWTVEEMAGLVGMGTTLFTEKVKSFSGFSPINYLINIRISEAIKLLKRADISVTNIALDTGFYSSQHFSTTFKKLTGYRPSEFRKNHLRNI
ncbi:helix-turn-helix transcriptional regulator [Chitinophaga tropicalis]|uniref:Helix-turn-helix domain-containing protein n=1 Tax=Chitinophaga tropicalis TaxID=2683588 RepID=A0A7K1U1X7_9BACT|nr:AraC family transcriptional regulator [Chitinophaga tropicalis]MVT08359.1 helix-turn-helix domain-containing protein [Chitinophaga tropicalis]